MSPLLISIVGMVLLVTAVVLGINAMSRSINKSVTANTRNYKVRFNPANKKYYIANSTSLGDIDVRKYGLFTIYYKSKIDADFVMQKLNSNS